LTRRAERVASQIRRLVAELIQHRLADPRVAPLTSITRVTVSPDLTFAKIYVSVMATPGKQSATLAALRHATGMVRTYLGRELGLRHAPEVAFELDESLQKAAQTIELIDRTMAEDAARRAGQNPTAAGDDSTENEAEDRPDAAAADGQEIQETAE
jgi:ribosome-binding factor A